MEKGLKIASVLHTALWIIFFAFSIIGRFSYKAPTDIEPFDYASTIGVYNVFILIAAIGIFISALLTVCLYSVFQYENSKSSILKKVTLCISSLINLLFYLAAWLLFNNGDDGLTIAVLVIFGAFVVTCLALLIVVKVKKRPTIKETFL